MADVKYCLGFRLRNAQFQDVRKSSCKIMLRFKECENVKMLNRRAYRIL